MTKSLHLLLVSLALGCQVIAESVVFPTKEGNYSHKGWKWMLERTADHVIPPTH